MPRSTAKVFKKRKGRISKRKSDTSTDGNSHAEPNLSASEKKIGSSPSFSDEGSSGIKSIIMDLNLLTLVFNEHVRCEMCNEKGLQLIVGGENCGVVLQLELNCPKCPYKYKFYNSKKHDSNNLYDLNTRLVYAMRSIGGGASSAKMFCGIMNLPPPPTKFSVYNNVLLKAVKETCEDTMVEAAMEAIDANNGNRDITVAVDGTWQKRGYSSKNGVVSVTSVTSGKVLDIEILSKHCLCPNKTDHLMNCKSNFNGYSGKREVDGAVSMFSRSESKYHARYTKYLGDGDSKAYDSVVANNVYGDECPVEKLECIGHVMKRMGTRLRRLKTQMRGKKAE